MLGILDRQDDGHHRSGWDSLSTRLDCCVIACYSLPRDHIRLQLVLVGNGFQDE